MIIRELEEARKGERLVKSKNWDSTRLLLAGDDMGFSFHITRMFAGSVNTFEYKHHFESVYVISGEGTIEDHATGEVHTLRPGVMYGLNKHDRHTVRTAEGADLVVACCFNPPVTGTEVHREDGSYAPMKEAV